MKKFVLMHCGFEKPSPEMMEKWNAWFASIADHTVENIGFRGGREISKDGVAELSFTPDAITGISIVNAESLEHAQKLAEDCPFIASIRVYEAMSH